jgi:hypothetical protein
MLGAQNGTPGSFDVGRVGSIGIDLDCSVGFSAVVPGSR